MLNSQGVPVLISLQSSSSADGEDAETISLLTAGELRKTADGHLLCYEEALDESVAPTQVELLLEGDVISMCRSGDYDANMIFRKGQRYEGQYRTPYGVFDLALFCIKAHYTINAQDGELHLQYQLDVNGQYAAMHDLALCFSVKEGKA